jgi:hypothetical protein
MLADEAGKTATATARGVVPQLVQTKVSSPDPKALEKEREDRRRNEKETERRTDLEAMAREKRENDEAAEAKEAQVALRALKERELNAEKLRVAAAEAKKTAEDALANLEAAEAAAEAQAEVSAESAVFVAGSPISEGKDDAMMVEIANLLKDQTEGTDTNKPVDPKPLTRPREGEDDTPSRQERGEMVQGAPKRSLSDQRQEGAPPTMSPLVRKNERQNPLLNTPVI